MTLPQRPKGLQPATTLLNQTGEVDIEAATLPLLATGFLSFPQTVKQVEELLWETDQELPKLAASTLPAESAKAYILNRITKTVQRLWIAATQTQTHWTTSIYDQLTTAFNQLEQHNQLYCEMFYHYYAFHAREDLTEAAKASNMQGYVSFTQQSLEVALEQENPAGPTLIFGTLNGDPTSMLLPTITAALQRCQIPHTVGPEASYNLEMDYNSRQPQLAAPEQNALQLNFWTKPLTPPFLGSGLRELTPHSSNR